MTTTILLHDVVKIKKVVRDFEEREGNTCAPFTTTKLVIETRDGKGKHSKEELVIKLFHREAIEYKQGELEIVEIE
jgi:hypothetical protein|tara:strand:- start:25 stop:252 length:228 start_codon:yes stop_codon:yes gene_type:complete